MNDLIVTVLIWAPGVLFAITLHEWAHGYVAYLYGDSTAAQQGRLTLNPLPHIDPVMTLLVPGLMLISSMMTVGVPFVFGGAKPVPVDTRRFQRTGVALRIALFWVALAGPLMNLLMALLCALALRALFAAEIEGVIAAFLIKMGVAALKMNCLLAVFNLLPLPPLDGGRVAMTLLPPPLDRMLGALERFGLPIILLLAFSGLLGSILSPTILFVMHLFVGIAAPSG